MTVRSIVLTVAMLAISASGQERVHTIVAFGDSTTAKRGPLPVYATRLQKHFADRGRSVQVINAGIGGNNTQHAAKRFEKDVLAHTPDTVIIQFGINDAAVDVWKMPPATRPRVPRDTYNRNLNHFVSTLKKTGARVILMTPNPLRWTKKLKGLYGRTPYDPESPEGFQVLLKDYTSDVRRLAEKQSVILVDVDRIFRSAAKEDNSSIDSLLLDGMHPNKRGHELITRALLTVLDRDQPAPTDVEPLVASISKQTLWQNRDASGRTWFHPRVCMMPGKDGKPVALMNLQEIAGSDYFGPVHWSESRDLGKTWSDPAPIAAFGRDPVTGRTDGLMAGVCDVSPQYHPQTNTVIALGHVVFYKGQYFARDEQLARYPVYAVRSADGDWSERRILQWDDPRGGHIYTNNCGQRVILPDGRVQMSFTFGPKSEHRMVAGVHADYNGKELSINTVGPPLHNRKGRGLLEPSVTRFHGQFWMTIRAEDSRGYVAVSKDGLNWEEKQEWSWDDGTPLDMSTTQQHWLTHSDGLFLVYTRKDASNTNVIRWRSPLWLAQVDPQRRCLIRKTERVVLPLVGDGVDAPNKVALMGNFDVTNVSPHESWVTVGEWMPRDRYRGNVLLARIRWSRPNRLPLW